MSNEFYWMLAIHVVIFLVFRWRLNLKKKSLQREKADLTVEKTHLQGELGYYKRLVDRLENEKLEKL